MKALLLSGGMDSSAIAYWKKPDIAYTVDYGQLSADAEIRASKAVTKVLKIKHEIIKIDCSPIGTGEMAGENVSEIAPVPEWWPFRNQLLVTFVAAKGVIYGLNEIFVGTVKSDGLHADGTRRFYKAINTLTKLQEGSIQVTAPAIEYSTVELIQHSKIPKSILAWTYSCHTGNLACGQCRGCNKHTITLNELKYN